VSALADTLGPWEARLADNGIEWEVNKPDDSVPGGEWNVAVCIACADDRSAEQNARLFAAVPQLVLALRKIAQVDESGLAELTPQAMVHRALTALAAAGIAP
jgi:hypothetical protein